MARKSSVNPLLDAQNRINRAMVDGVGGLQFTAQAPPGIGRLIRIPFYLTTTSAGFSPLGTTALAATASGTSTTQPVINGQSPNEAGSATAITGTILLTTPQISWATLRIVGFESAVRYPVLPNGPVAQLCYSDLKIGGGANLFVHEDFAPADIYLAGQDSFAGLRDYPILKSPNTAQVAAQIVGPVGSTVSRITFSASLVCEILVDDNYGAHIPGAYARAGALVRQGGSFVNR
jgi:hypothetical protein